MASKYEEMRGVEETARKNWIAHRERCRQYMGSLVVGMLGYCGIPDDRVSYLRWDEAKSHYSEPEQGQYLLPGAMVFDDAGDCRLGVCIVFTPRGTFPERWASFGLFVSEQGGKVLAQLGPDKPILIDLKNQSQCNEFYDVVVSRIKQSFTEPQKPGAESIGFKRSQLATDEENQSPKSSNVA